MGRVVKGINDLKTCRPDLLKEWDFDLNTEIAPDEIAARSNKKVWWRCSKGHSWSESPDKRLSGRNCPYCSGKRVLKGFNDLATTNPDLVKEWNYSKNGDLLPEQISEGSHTKVWWKCLVCGNEWYVSPNDRKHGLRCCPKCSAEQGAQKRLQTMLKNANNAFASACPLLLPEWDYSKNIDLDPSKISINSSKKVWWKCSICGNEWQAQINNRAINASGCPVCMKHKRTSFPEQAIYYYLSKYINNVENGYTNNELGKKMELDIYIPSRKIAIEYDGVAWHTGEKNRKRDSNKYDACKRLGIKLIRLSEFDPGEKTFCDKLIIREGTTTASLDKALAELVSYLKISNVIVNTEKDRAAILKQYITVIKNKSIAAIYPQVVKEWDVEKNGGLTADMINANSNETFWWRCSLGHSYKASPANRFNDNNNCPYCSNHKLLAGFNDLQTRYPEIAKKWDYEKNKPKTPSEVIFGTVKKYYWKCEKGHSYAASPNYKVYGSDVCPYCSNTKILPGFNDIATVHPEIMDKWCYKKNDKKPAEYISNSHAVVWWECEKGHIWKRAINAEVNYDGCPICVERVLVKGENDLATLYPDFVSEWNYALNEKGPSEFTRTSRARVWWKCKECGHEWQAVIYNRIMAQTGCPKCGYSKKMQATRKQSLQKSGHTLAKEFPELLLEWDHERNTLNPEEISPGANYKVWWKCKKGHSYQAWLNDRTGKRKTGCPYCAGKRKLKEE